MTEDLSKFSFIFDVDGTLCPIKNKEQSYEDLVPNPKLVDKIKDYKSKGAKIVIFSSRNMNSYDCNLGLINKFTAPVLQAWLAKWDIPYDEILFGKPWPGHYGFYVDDRTIRPDEFINLEIDEMNELCEKSRSK